MAFFWVGGKVETAGIMLSKYNSVSYYDVGKIEVAFKCIPLKEELPDNPFTSQWDIMCNLT